MGKDEIRTAGHATKRTSSRSPSLVRSTKNSGVAAARESSGQLISHILQVSQTPGIKREAVFKKGAPRKIYAYYVLPSDPSKMVREDAKGKKFIGRVTNGKFRVLRSITL
jgi:hypothetical protein